MKNSKNWVGPVLKYIIRQYEKLAKGQSEGQHKLAEIIFILAVKNRLYDVFFELGKDPGAWNCDNLETLDCEVFMDASTLTVITIMFTKIPFTRTAFMWEKMTAANPTITSS